MRKINYLKKDFPVTASPQEIRCVTMDVPTPTADELDAGRLDVGNDEVQTLN